MDSIKELSTHVNNLVARHIMKGKVADYTSSIDAAFQVIEALPTFSFSLDKTRRGYVTKLYLEQGMVIVRTFSIPVDNPCLSICLTALTYFNLDLTKEETVAYEHYQQLHGEAPYFPHPLKRRRY